MAENILTLPVSEVLSCYRRKVLSPVDVMQAVLSQTRSLNPELNAFALLADDETLLRQTLLSESRWAKGKPLGPLDGIPVTIKDGADVIGWPTREGSAASSDKPAQEDSPLVARLRDAGAIFLGKTTTPEFGHKGVTDSPAFGITRNPWNAGKTSGGSSGGAAVAAATRMGFLHHGTDGGGSIRIPASFCGVFGIKPTQGRIPGLPSLFSSLASSGPLTRTVEDAALMLEIMADDFTAAVHETPKGLRIAYAPTINTIPIQPEVAVLIRDTAKKFQAVGTVEEISLQIPRLVDTFNKHWFAVASWLLRQFPEELHEKMDSSLVMFGRLGEAMHLQEYLDAEMERLLIIEQIEALFIKYDILILPTMALTPFEAGQNSPMGADGAPWEDWTPLTFPANLCRLPAASLPCGLTKEGLPVGVQIVSAPMKDALVLQVAHAMEREIGFTDWLMRNDASYVDDRKRIAK